MFQSAPPVKGAIHGLFVDDITLQVSIRAPREGGDAASTAEIDLYKGFNPRPP